MIGLARLVRGDRLTLRPIPLLLNDGMKSAGNRQSALSGRRTNRTWIAETLPRTTREVGVWIETECGVTYDSRSGLIALLHRLGMEHRKPKAVSSKLDPDKQAAFIKSYENLLNHIGDDEAVLFGDAVHPTHAVRPVGCWAPKDTPVAVEQTSGRQRLNIHGAIDLETGQTRMIEAATVNAISMIMLLRAIDRNRHVQASSPEQVFNRTSPRRSRSQAS